jgi:hypothetical protein
VRCADGRKAVRGTALEALLSSSASSTPSTTDSVRVRTYLPGRAVTEVEIRILQRRLDLLLDIRSRQLDRDRLAAIIHRSMQHATSLHTTCDMTVPHAQYQQARCNAKQTVVVANNPSGHHTSNAALRRAPLLDEERLPEQLRQQRDDPVVG